MRSPAYPSIDLEKAVGYAKSMYEYAKRHEVELEGLYKHWGFKGKTGTTKKISAALKYYGLTEQKYGTGKVQLSSRSFQIIHGIDGSDEQRTALKDAFLSPKMYAYCWHLWGSDDVAVAAMKSHLILEKNFNDSTVGGFIADYKRSRDYCGIASAHTSDEQEDEDEGVEVKVGDFVQWESQGVLQLMEPKRVISFSEDGNYLFVEGSDTGIPSDEVEVQDAPKSPPPKLDLDGNSARVPTPPLVSSLQRQESFSLGESSVSLSFPAEISTEEFEDLTDWLVLIHRKIRRTVSGDDLPVLSVKD